MALVWIALLIEFAAAFMVAAALAYWAQRNLTGARDGRARARRSPRRGLADLRTTGNHRAPCADH